MKATEPTVDDDIGSSMTEDTTLSPNESDGAQSRPTDANNRTPENSAKLVDISSLEWTDICFEKEYIPSKKDVGCRLRIEVLAVSTIDNITVLAGPVEVFTDAVLSAPAAPPKRVITDKQTISLAIYCYHISSLFYVVHKL